LRYRLLAGGAGIHVDFHADGNFDDLRGLPSHCRSPCKWDEIRPIPNLATNESFASEMFAGKPATNSCCDAASIHGFLRPVIKTKADQQVQLAYIKGAPPPVPIWVAAGSG
jgi:hypothetical protein